jgi:Domain of unknown function (DUF4394)
MFQPKSLRMLAVCLSASILMVSCSKQESFVNPALQEELAFKSERNLPLPKGTIFYALTNNNEIIKYLSGNPLSEISNAVITGLVSATEKILAIDFRPATGQLYGVSSESRLYVINQQTGAAAAVSLTAFTPAINGTQVAFDFNPTVDRIRLVTNTGQNLRLNPETGTVAATDGNINPAGSAITAVAYTNSVAGAATTTLYDIDVEKDMLYIQNPPNAGTLVPVGSLGLQAVGEAGFDIAPDNSVAIAAIFGRGFEAGEPESSNGNKYRFYYIDLMTGAATNAGTTNKIITGLAIPTNPVAYAVDAANRLLIFNPASAAEPVSKTITGLQALETIVGIDMRPATAQLYALGSTSRLYTINMSNGAAMAVGTAAFSPALSGTSFGFDFNPTVDRIRVVSNTGQNLRLHPVTGVVAVADPNLNPGAPSVDGAAYTNSFAGATTTTLFDIDYNTDKLHIQNPANAGTLDAGKALGIDVASGNGFDIGGSTNKAWAIFTVNGSTGLYAINLSAGNAEKIRSFAAGVKGFALGLGF